MSILPTTQRLLSAYDFDFTAANVNDGDAPYEPHYTQEDLNAMSRDAPELVNAIPPNLS